MHMHLFELCFCQILLIPHTFCIQNSTVGVNQSRVEPKGFILIVELHTYFVALPIGKMRSRKALPYIVYSRYLFSSYSLTMLNKIV